MLKKIIDGPRECGEPGRRPDQEDGDSGNDQAIQRGEHVLVLTEEYKEEGSRDSRKEHRADCEAAGEEDDG